MTRLDRALAERGLARSRTEAQTLIAAGQVQVGGETVTKLAFPVADAAVLSIHGARPPFVSRGGIKLAAALDIFGLDVKGVTALDVGASTGGFTDCLIQRGAARVVAIDAGHGQLAPEIAHDPRVETREGVNARFLTPGHFSAPFDMIVADVSFISLTLLLPTLTPLVCPAGMFILLVKPQFEVGREALGKGGIVRDTSQREAALQRVVAAAGRVGLIQRGVMPSPILGAEGNAEFLLWLERPPQGNSENKL